MSGLKLPPEITIFWILLFSLARCRIRSSIVPLQISRYTVTCIKTGAKFSDEILKSVQRVAHSHLLGLSQTMGPIHGLLVNGRIPVAIVENDLKGYENTSKYGTRELHLRHNPSTVSAAVRLMPRPPARVLKRKTKISDLGRERIKAHANCL